MEKSSLNYLIENICSFYIEQNAQVDKISKNFSVVRIHNENKLKSSGDLSFPISISIWQNYFARTKTNLREDAFAMFQETEGEETDSARKGFLAAAVKWALPVERLQIQNERCCLYLQRKTVTEQLLRHVLASTDAQDAHTLTYGQMRKNPHRRIILRKQPALSSDDADLSLYRANSISQTLSRVLTYSDWSVSSETDIGELEEPELLLNLEVISVTAARSCRRKGEAFEQQTSATIKCGIVSDPLTGKLAKVELQEYLNLRSNDMRLMAMHKYGIRAKDDRRFCVLMERLGAAAVIVDLLEVKHSSPVQIIRNGQGSTKGASFILYNSARLESLLRSFDERVQNSRYGQLPGIDEVDLSLLNEEEEWQLVFGYILAFPHLIERCLEQLESGACATHLIVRFLSGFVSVFSVYYRRIRILTEMRDHLMPFVYARIYLIKAVREILNKTLALLAIDPVQFM